jgi:signal transduction histidine kinase
VAELLDVSRLAAGWTIAQRVPATLDDLVEQAVRSERVAEPGRAFLVNLPRPPVVVLMDPSRMEQVLINLLENARKYSPPHCPVHIAAAVRGQDMHLSVRDEGVGIPLEEQGRIFDRFHRAGNIDRGVSGFGLGLYIAHELVRAHGGRLEVQSQPNQGSTFTIILPNAVVDSATEVREAVGNRQ